MLRERYSGIMISIGVDIGREHDLTALVLVEGTPEVDWIRKATTMRRAPFDQQEETIRRWKEAHNPGTIVIDKTYNPQLAENMRNEYPYIVQEFGFTEQSKADLIGKALERFTAGKVRCPQRYRSILEELSFIRKEVTPAGNVVFRDQPHGDLGWACLLAIWGLRYEKGLITTYSFDF